MIFGEYEVMEKIGNGGVATVFKARLTGGVCGFSRLVALKVLSPALSTDTEMIKAFVNEAQLGSRLEHGNIVRVHHLGQMSGSYYLEMELIDGHSLRQVMNRCQAERRRLSVVDVCLVGIGVAHGLAYAHAETSGAAPVIHRDLSPQNILLSRAGEVKIADFGVAHAVDTIPTRTGILKGNYAYMSPEQAACRVVDIRSDLFSFGIVLWELLTGQRLFWSPEQDPADTLAAIMSAQISPPSTYNQDVPAALDDLVLGLLERDVRHRLAGAVEVASRLEHVLSGFRSVERMTSLGRLHAELFGVEIDVLPTSNSQAHQVQVPLAREPTTVAGKRRQSGQERGASEPPLEKTLTSTRIPVE